MADLEEDYEMVNWPQMSDSEDEVEIKVFVELTQDELDRATTEKIDSGNENSEAVKTFVEEFDSKGGLHDAVKHDCFPSTSTDGRTSVEPKVSEEGLLDTIQQDYFPSASIESFELPLSESKMVGSEGKPLVIIDDYIGCSKYFDSGKADVKIFQEFPVLEKMDSGNKESQKKSSLEEFDSEVGLDAVKHDHFPCASTEKSDFSVAGVKIATGQTPVVIEDNGRKSFELPLSESKRVRSEGKPLVIIDDYIGCSKYFDSGKVDVKIFQEFPVLEKMDSGNKESQKKSSLEEFGSEVGLDAVKHDHFPCALTEKSDFSVAGVKIATGQTPVVIEDNGPKKSDSADEESTRRAFNVIDNEAEKDHKDESIGVEVRAVGGPDAAIDDAAEMIPPK